MTAPTIPPSTAASVGPAPKRAPAAIRRAALAARRLGARFRRSIAGNVNRPVWLIAPIAAIWAAAIGLALVSIPFLAIWMAAPESGLTWIDSVRTAGLVWVVAHGTPIALGGTTYSLLPWGLAVIPVVLLVSAGGWTVRRTGISTGRGLIAAIILGVGGYAAVVAATAQFTSRPDANASPPLALAYSAAMGVLAFGWGATRSAQLTDEARRLVPGWLTVIARSGLIGVFTLLSIGAVAAAAALLVNVDDAITMSQALRPGLWGGLALLLLGIAYVPVLVVWSASYLIGAGVMIGPAVVVSPFIPVTAPTQLPPFPMLAALPQSAGPIAWLLPLGGIVAGVLVGLSIARRSRDEPRLFRMAMAMGAAAFAGIAMLVLAYLSDGSLGDLRLAHLGPSPMTVAILTTVLLTLGAVPSAVIVSPPSGPALTVAESESLPVEAEDV